jgi:hypothetical protein
MKRIAMKPSKGEGQMRMILADKNCDASQIATIKVEEQVKKSIYQGAKCFFADNKIKDQYAEAVYV